MEIKNEAHAGTLLSNDCYITVSPHGNLCVELESSVKEKFGKEIMAVTHALLKQLEVTKGKIEIKDKGALNYTIEARLETAVKRANG